MTAENGDTFLGFVIPEPRGVIEAHGHHAWTVERKPRGENGRFVTRQSNDALPRLRIPDLRGLIVARGYEVSAAGLKPHIAHRVLVLYLTGPFPGLPVPKDRVAVGARGHDPARLRVHRHAANGRAVPEHFAVLGFVLAESGFLACRQNPEPGRAVGTRRDEPGFLRGFHEVGDPNTVGVAFEEHHRVMRRIFDIPNPDLPVAAGAGEPVSVPGPGETGHLLFVSDQVKRIRRFGRFPERGLVIVARGSGKPGIRVPAWLGIQEREIHFAAMTGEWEIFFADQVPDPRGVFLPAGD